MQRSFSQIGQIATIQSKENAYTHLCFESIDFVSIHPDLQLHGNKIDLPGEACLFDTRIFRSMLIDSNGSFLGLVIFFITVIFYSNGSFLEQCLSQRGVHYIVNEPGRYVMLSC